MTDRQRYHLVQRILTADFGDALEILERELPESDPAEAYWDIVERAEMDAELAEDF
jgi:hypothetical protein